MSFQTFPTQPNETELEGHVESKSQVPKFLNVFVLNDQILSLLHQNTQRSLLNNLDKIICRLTLLTNFKTLMSFEMKAILYALLT